MLKRFGEKSMHVEMMDEDDRAKALEDAGLDPDDWDE